MALSPHNALGVGDAENDHAFLALCECSVAVANALPSLIHLMHINSRTARSVHARLIAMESSMRSILLMSAAALVLSGCAALAKQDGAEDHAAHHPSEATAAPAAVKADQQMQMMREMHQKMQAAKTPQERAALMDEHMKAMQGGMSMMCDMGGGMGMGAQGGAGSKDMMSRCMEMKDMTMQMMMDREAAKAPAAK